MSGPNTARRSGLLRKVYSSRYGGLVSIVANMDTAVYPLSISLYVQLLSHDNDPIPPRLIYTGKDDCVLRLSLHN